MLITSFKHPYSQKYNHIQKLSKHNNNNQEEEEDL